MHDDQDLSPAVAADVQAKGRRHLAVLLFVVGVIAIVFPYLIAMPAEVAANARLNSAIMGVIGIVTGILVMIVRRAPRRWTL